MSEKKTKKEIDNETSIISQEEINAAIKKEQESKNGKKKNFFSKIFKKEKK